jgi:hypothetical protein
MRIVRPLIVLTVLTVGLIIGFGGATVQPPLLVVIVFLLLYQQFRKRDFYVVEHLLYDLNFIESSGSHGRPNMRVERGPMLDGGASRSVGFSDYAAAKASFDYQEELFSNEPMRGNEAIHRVYVISASRKPANALLKDDKSRGNLLHTSPHQITYARRREAKEDRLLGIENEASRKAWMASQSSEGSGTP